MKRGYAAKTKTNMADGEELEGNEVDLLDQNSPTLMNLPYTKYSSPIVVCVTTLLVPFKKGKS